MQSADYLYPRSRFRGKMNPENLIFNANLQEFSQRVTYLTALANNGKMSLEESYQQIEQLWQQLQPSSPTQS